MRELRRSVRLRVLVAVAAGMTIAACGGSGTSNHSASAGGSAKSGSQAKPTSLTIAVAREVPPLDPQKYGRSESEAVNEQIFESLLWPGPGVKAAVVPQLAAALPKQINDTTWRFKLRPGVTFSNGKPMTADDVVYSVNRTMDPKVDSTRLPILATSFKAVKIDASTVDVITKDYDLLLPQQIMQIKITPAGYYDTDPNAAAGKPVGTGPYMWVSGAGNGPIVLKRNPKYWGEAPSIPQLTFKVIPDASTALSALRAGEIDLMTRLPPDETKSAPQVFTSPGTTPTMLQYNTKVGVTADPRVRRALTMAIDRNALVKQLWSGYADVTACQIMQPGGIGYNSSLKPLPYDPAQAKTLIQQAGATGKTINLATGVFFPKGTEAVQAIASYWEAIGLKVKLKVYTDATQYGTMYYDKYKRPEAVYVLPGGAAVSDVSAITTYLASDGGASTYDNPKVDSLFQQAGSARTLDQNGQLVSRALGIACNDAAIGDLFNAQNIWGGSTSVHWTPRASDEINGIYVPNITLGSSH